MPTPHEVRILIDSLSPVQKLVHLAVRYDSQQQEAIRAELVQTRKQEYESTLTELAGAGGCNQKGLLGEGAILKGLNKVSKEDAESITLTYNRDLAVAIIAIREENPSANRHYYANRLETWEVNRAEHKDLQIAANTRLTARQMAMADFTKYNDVEATVEPLGNNPAAESICQELLDRGRVLMKEAAGFPAHINCVHFYGNIQIKPIDNCKELWLGK